MSVPKLRFPEFLDAGEWEEKRLEEIGDVLMCKRIFANETNNSSGVPFYKIGTLGSKPDAFISTDLFNEYKSKYNFPRKGEILITCSGTVGKCLPYDGKDAYYQDSNIVWIDNPRLAISNEFLHDLLLNVNWGSLNSTTITRIYGSDLRSLSLTFPIDPQEQQKIVDCLSSLSDRITAETQKLDTLKAHKKGLMQQLFPAEGETLPKLRFPEFHDSGEWEKKKLGVLSTFIKERFPLEQLRLSNYVSTENILPDYGGVTTASKLPPSGTATHFKKNDILISNIRPYLKKVWLSNKEGGASNDVIVVRSKEQINYHYLSFMLKNDVFIEYVMKGAKGVKMPRGDISLMKEYPLAYPRLPEQRKIADCLSFIDELITAQTKKIDALKLHKKGLMQQLFPSVEEVRA